MVRPARNAFYGVAQLVEQQNLDLLVVGSSPTSVANFVIDGLNVMH